MGQYRQWLLYRDTDQQLQHQIQKFEDELTQLYTQIDQLETDTISPENIILQTLISIQQAEKMSRKLPVAHATSLSEEQSITKPQRGTVSPALFGRSNLPNFNTQHVGSPAANAAAQNPVPQFQQPNSDLLPPNISALADDSNPTDPQTKAPWWLRNTHPTPKEHPQSTQPIDQQSRRTNQYVQRWFERWGTSTAGSEQTQERRGQ
jgi:hypothetical protein